MTAAATRSLARALLVLCAASLASSLYAAPLIKPVDEQKPASDTNANANTSAHDYNKAQGATTDISTVDVINRAATNGDLIGNSGISTVPVEWTHDTTVGTITRGSRGNGWNIYDWSTQTITSPATVTYKCSGSAYVQVFLWNSEPCKSNNEPISLDDYGGLHAALSPSGDSSCVTAYCRWGDFHFFENGWPGILDPAALQFTGGGDEFQLRINDDRTVTALRNSVELATTSHRVQYPINVAVAATTYGDAMLTDMTITGGEATPSPASATAYPTSAPTPSPSPAMTNPSAIGDPHLTNVHGDRFDLMQEGKHLLIKIPHDRKQTTLLRVDAVAERFGGQCADIYFQELNVTGKWADTKQTGGFHYHAQGPGIERAKRAHWVRLGPVQLKVAHGRTQKGVKYLNFYVKNLGHTGHVIGGLLGEDDHTKAEKSPKACLHLTAL